MQAEYRTVSAPVTLIVPAQVDSTTPLTLFSTVEEVYASIAGSAIAREIVHLLLEATRDSGAVVVLYRHDNETTARVLWPVAVFVHDNDEIELTERGGVWKFGSTVAAYITTPVCRSSIEWV